MSNAGHLRDAVRVLRLPPSGEEEGISHNKAAHLNSIGFGPLISAYRRAALGRQFGENGTLEFYFRPRQTSTTYIKMQCTKVQSTLSLLLTQEPETT